jgi:hypothetical protein
MFICIRINVVPNAEKNARHVKYVFPTEGQEEVGRDNTFTVGHKSYVTRCV